MFGWFAKKAPEMFPDINRVPVDSAIPPVIQEYESRRSAEKLGLCLEGGGAKGGWQAGIVARIAEIGLLDKVDVIVGTSVGGMNAAVISRYMGESPNMQAVVDIWRGITSNAAIYKGEMPSSFYTGLKTLIGGGLGAASLLDNSPQYDLVNKHLGGDVPSARPVHVITTDYITRTLRVLGPDASPVDQALATSAVPVAFPPYKGKYMDGGAVENCGVDLLLDLGCTKILVLYLSPDPSVMPVTAPLPNSINTGVAAIGAMFQVQSDKTFEKLEQIQVLRKIQGKDPIEVLHEYPEADLGDLLQFGAHPENLQNGYNCGVKYLTVDKVREFLKA